METVEKLTIGKGIVDINLRGGITPKKCKNEK